MLTFNTANISSSTNVANEMKIKENIHVDIENFFIFSFKDAVHCKFYSVLERRDGMCV